MGVIDTALICKALSDVNRLQIVQLLTSGEKCASELLEHFAITQPTLSHHMKVLSDCGLLNTRKEGVKIYYALNCETLTSFRDFIATLNCNKKKESGVRVRLFHKIN